jgi:hypothetical protein
MPEPARIIISKRWRKNKTKKHRRNVVESFAPASANPSDLNTESKRRVSPQWPQDEEQRFGDLSGEGQRTLKHVLKGEL